MAEEKDPLAPEPVEMSEKSFITKTSWVTPGPSPAVIIAGTYVGKGTPYPVPKSAEPKEDDPSAILKEAPLPKDYGKPPKEKSAKEKAEEAQENDPGVSPPEGKPFASDDKTHERPGVSQVPKRR